jgi:hypothetical protein
LPKNSEKKGENMEDDTKQIETQESAVEKKSEKKSLIHPFSGILVLLIDNLLFGANALSVGLSLPIVCTLAFIITGISVFFIEKHMDNNSTAGSVLRALVLAILAGVPTSIAGTAIGAIILSWAGLKKFF